MAAFGPTVLRLVAGVIFFAHGAQKLFGGLTSTAAMFEQLGLSPAFLIAMIIGGAEFAGGLLLIAGLFTRIVAGVLLIEMAVAVWKVHFANGFFLNWTNAAGAGHGYEFSLALIGIFISLLLTGPGALSIDRGKKRLEPTKLPAAPPVGPRAV